MAKAYVEVVLPKADATNSVETAEITKTALSADGVVIAGDFDASHNVTKKALANKNNSLQITIENTYTTADSAITIKAGDNYPNAILGDLVIPITKATAGASSDPDIPTIAVILLEDISRFENRDGSINLTISTNMTGNIWAVAKRAGIEAAADQGAFGTTNA